MAVEPASRSQAQSVRRLSRCESCPRRRRRRRQRDNTFLRGSISPPAASRGVSVCPARLTISGLAIDQKRAIAALGALAQVSRLDLFRLLLTCDLRGCLLARSPSGWVF